MPFSELFALYEMQTVSFMIWTQIGESTAYVNNYFITSSSTQYSTQCQKIILILRHVYNSGHNWQHQGNSYLLQQ